MAGGHVDFVHREVLNSRLPPFEVTVSASRSSGLGRHQLKYVGWL